MFSYKLAELLRDTNITINTLHPGVINTKLLREFWGASDISSSKTLEFMVTSPELGNITGKYYNNSQISNSSKISYDKNFQNEIWEMSEIYVKFKYGDY